MNQNGKTIASQIGAVVLSSAVAGTLAYWGAQARMERDVVHLQASVEKLDATTVKLASYVGLKEDLNEHRQLDGHQATVVALARVLDRVERLSQRVLEVEREMRGFTR